MELWSLPWIKISYDSGKKISKGYTKTNESAGSELPTHSVTNSRYVVKNWYRYIGRVFHVSKIHYFSIFEKCIRHIFIVSLSFILFMRPEHTVTLILRAYTGFLTTIKCRFFYITYFSPLYVTCSHENMECFTELEFTK